MTTRQPRFHLSIPVNDLDEAREFYGKVLGLPQGRSSESWVHWDFYGHHLVLHSVPDYRPEAGRHPVDGEDVPVPHFGVILDVDEFHVLADRLRAAGTEFVKEPHQRFVGKPWEQSTMFLLDPTGNALEFKAFRDESQLFATRAAE